MHYAIVAELGRTPSALGITPNAMGALRAIWLMNFYYLCGCAAMGVYGCSKWCGHGSLGTPPDGKLNRAHRSVVWL